MFAAFVRTEGCFGAGALKVHQRSAGADMSVDVDPGSAAVIGDDIAGQGTYIVSSAAVVNVTIPAAPATGTRTHRVVARVRDKLHNAGWTTYDSIIEVLADTGAGTPAEPPSAITLATVAVTAGQSNVTDANITDQRLFLAQLDNGAMTSYTPSTANFGTATFTNRQGFYYQMAPKLYFVRLQVAVNAAGSGANPIGLGLPFPPARDLRQIIPVHVEPGGSAQGVVFSGGASPMIDRVRIVGTNLNGADMVAGTLLTAQGIMQAA